MRDFGTGFLARVLLLVVKTPIEPRKVEPLAHSREMRWRFVVSPSVTSLWKAHGRAGRPSGRASVTLGKSREEWRVNAMQARIILRRASAVVSLVAALSASPLGVNESVAQQESRPAFVIIERTATTGDESIQEEYAKLAREILPKYGARHLARSQRNTLLEGDGPVPCCLAVLQFPNLGAVRRWYDSPENQSAAKVRQSGAKFRIIAIEGLPDQR